MDIVNLTSTLLVCGRIEGSLALAAYGRGSPTHTNVVCPILSWRNAALWGIKVRRRPTLLVIPSYDYTCPINL